MSVTPVIYPRTTISTGSGVHFRHNHVWVGNGKHVVGNNVFSLFKPKRTNLIEYLPLVRNVRNDTVKRGVSIGGDENDFIFLSVDVSHLTCLLFSQVLEIGFFENVHMMSSYSPGGARVMFSGSKTTLRSPSSTIPTSRRS